MFSWTRIARTVGIGALALLSGGCMVHSKLPLIPQSDFPAGIEGKYQVTGAMDAAERRKLPPAERVKCLDPGYSGEVLQLEEKGRKTKGPVHVFYCAYDPDKKAPLPVTTISRAGNAYRWTGDEKDKDAELRLRTIHPELFLGQFEQGDGGEPRFDYIVMRTRAGDVELFPMFCPDFPHAPTKPIELPKPLGGGTDGQSAAATPPELTECEIDSLDVIKGDLDAYVARLDAGTIVPLLILHRVAQ